MADEVQGESEGKVLGAIDDAGFDGLSDDSCEANSVQNSIHFAFLVVLCLGDTNFLSAQVGESSTSRPATTRSAGYAATILDAKKLLDEHKPDDSYRAAYSAMQLEPDRYEAYAAGALALMQAKKYDDAEKVAQLALARSPEQKRPAIDQLVQTVRAARASAVSSTPPPPQPVSIASSETGNAKAKSANLTGIREALVKLVEASGTFFDPDSGTGKLGNGRQREVLRDASLSSDGTLSWEQDHFYDARGNAELDKLGTMRVRCNVADLEKADIASIWQINDQKAGQGLEYYQITVRFRKKSAVSCFNADLASGEPTDEVSLELKDRASAEAFIKCLFMIRDSLPQFKAEALASQEELKAKTEAATRDPKAAFDLGVRYEYGIGTPKDLAKAMELYRMSANGGNEMARKHMRELGRE